MTDKGKHHNVELRDGDATITSADATTSTLSVGTVQVSLHAQSGHLSPGSRANLVDAVLDLPNVQTSAHLQATVPLGDAESLERLQQRTEDMTTRAAGSTILVDADMHPEPAAAGPAPPVPAPPEDIG